jgi:hypothetical protein
MLAIIMSLVAAVARRFIQGRHADRYLGLKRVTILVKKRITRVILIIKLIYSLPSLWLFRAMADVRLCELASRPRLFIAPYVEAVLPLWLCLASIFPRSSHPTMLLLDPCERHLPVKYKKQYYKVRSLA